MSPASFVDFPRHARSWLLRFILVCLLLPLLAPVAWATVDLNTADEAQLRTVKGIGPVKAKAILAYRARNGAFRSAGDLRKVKGFGAKTIARIAHDVTLSGKPIAPPAAPPAPPVRKPGR